MKNYTKEEKYGSTLEFSDDYLNLQVSSGHIAVENYFDRLCIFWTLFSKNVDGERICMTMFSTWAWNSKISTSNFSHLAIMKMRYITVSEVVSTIFSVADGQRARTEAFRGSKMFCVGIF